MTLSNERRKERIRPIGFFLNILKVRRKFDFLLLVLAGMHFYLCIPSEQTTVTLYTTGSK